MSGSDVRDLRHQPRRIAAVILAGGEGLRLGGVVKANVTIGGVTADRPGSGGARRIAGRCSWRSDGMVARRCALPAGASAGASTSEAARGPLAGLAAAARGAPNRRNRRTIFVSAAVDSPFLPPDFVARLVRRLTQRDDAAIATYCGQPYPTNAAWRLDALRPLLVPETLAALRTGRDQGVCPWSAHPRSWNGRRAPAGDPFANLNTPADRDDLERRAAAEAAADPAQNAALNGVGKPGQSR